MFIRSCLNPNFQFSRSSSGDDSDPSSRDKNITPRLQVSDERVGDGILVMEKSKQAKVIHQDELLERLGEKKHEVWYASCCPVNFGNFEGITNTGLTSSSMPILSKCSWLRFLSSKISNELPGANIQEFGEHLQVESCRLSICLKDNCPYRITKGSQSKSLASFCCCTWSATDENLAWKIISIVEKLDSSAT